MGPRLNWLTCTYHAFLVISLAYLIAQTGSVGAATTRTTNLCRNETTTVVVNETTEEWCAGFSSVYCYAFSSCYCNVTREVEKTHVTEICEAPTSVSDTTTSTTALPTTLTNVTSNTTKTEMPISNELTLVDGALSGGKGRKLTDPEIAAIAVICSLVFSILLSLTVFCAQRRCSVCAVLFRKNRPTEVVQVVRGDGNEEGDKFIRDSDAESRYVTVEAANKPLTVHEDVTYEEVAYKTVPGRGDVDVSVRKKTPGNPQHPLKFVPYMAQGDRASNRKLHELPSSAPIKELVKPASNERRVRICDNNSSENAGQSEDIRRHSKDSFTQTLPSEQIDAATTTNPPTVELTSRSIGSRHNVDTKGHVDVSPGEHTSQLPNSAETKFSIKDRDDDDNESLSETTPLKLQLSEDEFENMKTSVL